MSEKSYQEFKSTYVTIARGFDVLPDNLSMIDADLVNPSLEGKTRYEKYMDVSGFNDAQLQCIISFQKRNEIFLASLHDLLLSHHNRRCDCLCEKRKRIDVFIKLKN